METVEVGVQPAGTRVLPAGHGPAIERLRAFAAAPLPESVEAALGLRDGSSHLTDALTGLQSRAAFRARLHDEIAGLDERGETAVEVVVLEILGFDDVAEYLGRVRADELLRSVADRICATVGDDVPVARVGSSTFALCCVSAHDAERLDSPTIAPLRSAFSAPVPIQGLGAGVHVRAHVGSTVVTERGVSPDAAVDAARRRSSVRR